MATATIPELIQPGVLFTPDDTPFSVSAGALPNTDDALSLDGSSGVYRAYQPAISGIHYPASPDDPFTICFWCGPFSGSSTSGNAFVPSAMIMGVTDLTASSANTASNSSTTGFAWGISWANALSSTITLRYHRAVGATSRAAFGAAIPDSSYAMLTIRDPGGGVAPTIRQDGLNTVSRSSPTGGTPGTPGALTSPNFSLGPYPTTAGWGVNVTKTMLLGKVALFNRLITDQEIQDLYTSMTLGPPSP